MQLSNDGSTLLKITANDIQNGVLVIPDLITHIGAQVFYDCTGLTEIIIPNSVIHIGDGAFQGCTGLTEINIPNSVIHIGDVAFQGCTGLTKVNTPPLVTHISDGAFDNCLGLTEVTIPNSVTHIGDYAFDNCLGLTEVTIPDSIIHIGDYAFYGCTGLIEVTIPNSVTHIGDYAFADCTRLGAVSIPTSVIHIGEEPFVSCNNLSVIAIDAPNLEEYERIHALIPQTSQRFTMLNKLWCEIKKAKKEALYSMSPIGINSFPHRLSEDIIRYIQQMEGSLESSLHDAMNQAPLPSSLTQLEAYKQALQKALSQFRQKHEFPHQQLARAAAINKLQQLIHKTEQALTGVKRKNPSFFDSSKNQLKLKESRERIAVAAKLINYLSHSETISLTEGERAILNNPRNSVRLILRNCEIPLSALLIAPPSQGYSWGSL